MTKLEDVLCYQNRLKSKFVLAKLSSEVLTNIQKRTDYFNELLFSTQKFTLSHPGQTSYYVTTAQI